MNVAYIRVSTVDQNEGRQYEALKEYDIKKYFVDKVSAKTIERPGLNELISFVRKDDIVYCTSLDRLGRNIAHLKQITEILLQKGVSLYFVKENLKFDENISPMGNLIFNVLGSFAQFEREYIRERQLEGIRLAQKEKKYKGRKATKLDDEIKKNIQFLLECGTKITEICRMYNFSRSTFYKYITIKKSLKME